jgi:hypothetical protein
VEETAGDDRIQPVVPRRWAMGQYCHSCGGPLADPNLKGPSDQFCRYCADSQGNLYPEERVQVGITQWLMTWQPGITEREARERAAHYMRAMPAWAEK